MMRCCFINKILESKSRFFCKHIPFNLVLYRMHPAWHISSYRGLPLMLCMSARSRTGSGLPRAGRSQLAELFFGYRPETFYRRQAGTVAWSRPLLPGACETFRGRSPAPVHWNWVGSDRTKFCHLETIKFQFHSQASVPCGLVKVICPVFPACIIGMHYAFHVHT